jgi:adenosylcobinamide kinase/adenosylcobinamide-phosphate guanylyltransferase
VATGEPLDDEMRARIEQHKKARPADWRTLEFPRDIGIKLQEQVYDAEVVIIDCLTLLVANLLGDESDYPDAENQVREEIEALLACMNSHDRNFIIVSNELGLGLVPDNRLGRIYRDVLGKANQLIAHSADDVYFMTAGIPVRIKGEKA